MPPITITLNKDGSVSMPIDVQVSSGQVLTWEVQVPVTGVDEHIAWLVSFRDGTAFDVGTKGAAQVTRSPDVRDGQEIRFSRGEYQPGRYSYRFAFHYRGKIYGVFDCPSIIIT